MLFGVFSAVVGATFIALGATVFPWFQSLAAPSAEGLSLSSTWLLAAAGLGALTAVLSLWLRRRRGAALTALSSLAALGLTVATLTARAPMAAGFWLALIGGLMMLVGAALQASSRSAFGKHKPLLRVSWLWNGSIVRQELLAEPRHVEIGADASGGLPIPGLVRERLFEADGRTGDYDLLVSPQLVGTLSVGGTRRTLGVGATTTTRLRLGGEDWGKLDFGDVSVVFQFMAPSSPAGVLAWLRVDAWAPTAVVVSLAAMLGFAAYLCASYEPELETRTLAVREKRHILVDAEVLTVKETPPAAEELEPPVALDEPPLGQRAPDAEGKMGEPKALDLAPKTPKQDGLKRERSPVARARTIVDLLTPQAGIARPLADLINGDTTGITTRIAGAMDGTEGIYIAGNGTGGLGYSGERTGGGGEGAPDGLRTLGDVNGVPGGTRVAVGLRPKQLVRARGTVSTQQGLSAGFCAKDNIASVVRSRASAIRACYENRLQVSPSLAGKLTARWTIGTEGRVTQATLSTSSVPDGAVGQCVLSVVRRLAFQKPSGGVCVVQWPFVFSPG